MNEAICPAIVYEFQFHEGPIKTELATIMMLDSPVSIP